jgi:MtfA peptidase
MLGFWKQRRRKRIVAEPFTEEWEGYLQDNVGHYRYLGEDERRKLKDDLRIFIAEKVWEGCGGLQLTDEMRVTIAGQACLLTLFLDNDYYPNIESILVYPTGYRVRTRRHKPGGVVQVAREHRLGEAHAIGPVILSWEDTLAGGRDGADGTNVAIHEFAHKLDMEDGRPEGTPRLHSNADYDEWHEVMSEAYDLLRRKLALAQPTVLDGYGATDASEFFAVATESFFERPCALQDEYPRLYDVLRKYYRQDPAERVRRFEDG